MKRLLLVFLLLATPVFAAPEKWFEAYDRGVTAVNTRNYKAGAEALQKAIAEMPNEGTNVRAKNALITYVPHFWLGIAKFNLGDAEGAPREWRICEEQGVVARTDYYAKMKDWVSRAQTERQRNAQTAASGAKKTADTAISKALEMQLNALSAGGDRAESYLTAQRKLLEARTYFQKAGTDVNAYKTAEQIAQQASSLFAAAAEEGKRIKAARNAAPPPVKKQQPAPQPAVVNAGVIAPPPAAIVPKTETAGLTPVISQAEVEKRIAEQEAKRKQRENPKLAAAADASPANRQPPTANTPAPDLRAAYRAYASGDLTTSERLLTNVLRAQPAAEAYLLRGCARYTRAMLSRTPDPLLLAATDDFRAALDRNRALRLDRNAFSPKLVAYFESIRKRR